MYGRSFGGGGVGRNSFKKDVEQTKTGLTIKTVQLNNNINDI